MPRICVLGLGYIGLPTAALFATSGHDVLGVDVNAEVVDRLQKGELHIEEPGLATVVRAALGSGRLTVAGKPEPSDVFILAVPTPVTPDHKADMRFVKAAARSAAGVLRKGNLVILESTSPPGTTRELLGPIFSAAGLKPGRDIQLAHCPERVLPGRIMKELVENDRVVGGIDRESAERAAQLYRSFVEGKIFTTEATTAEVVKLMENTYRDVNVALANELALLAEKLGIDAWEVVDLANRHPRVHLLRPGPGVGGHCIPVDPWFLVEKDPDVTRLIRTAREVNDAMPERVVHKLQGLVPPRGRVAVLGVAYKGNVDDTRETPALEVIEGLRRCGVEVAVHDPRVRRFHHPLVSIDEAARGADALVILADHDEFRSLDPGTVAPRMRAKAVLDTRGCLDRARWEGAGFALHLLGRGTA